MAGNKKRNHLPPPHLLAVTGLFITLFPHSSVIFSLLTPHPEGRGLRKSCALEPPSLAMDTQDEEKQGKGRFLCGNHKK